MIGHQYIGMDFESIYPCSGPKAFQVALIVIVVKKNVLLVYAALHDQLRIIFNRVSGKTGHGVVAN